MPKIIKLMNITKTTAIYIGGFLVVLAAMLVAPSFLVGNLDNLFDRAARVFQSPEESTLTVDFDDALAFAYNEEKVMFGDDGVKLRKTNDTAEVIQFDSTPLPEDAELMGFVENGEQPGESEIMYQVSADKGKWYYHDGRDWAPVGSCTDCYNTADEINTNIEELPIESDEIKIKAALTSSANATPILESVDFVVEGYMPELTSDEELSRIQSVLALATHGHGDDDDDDCDDNDDDNDDNDDCDDNDDDDGCGGGCQDPDKTAWVDSGKPGKDHCDEDKLHIRVKKDHGDVELRRTYLHFDDSPTPSGGETVSLRIDAEAKEAAVVGVYETSWNESCIDWNGSPAVGSLIDTTNITRDGYAYFDITSVSGGALDLVLKMEDETLPPGVSEKHIDFTDPCISTIGCDDDDDDDNDDDNDDDDCGPCDGKMTALTLRYLGITTGYIEVEQKKGGDIIFAGNVAPGGDFSFVGTDKKGTMGTEIIIYVDGAEETRIHTSCSNPLYVGMITGDFMVLAGESRNGGLLCPGSYCGDGDVDPGEACDDGNNLDGDGCSAVCENEAGPVCGNGVIEPPEECDDGNTEDGDGCSAVCALDPDAVTVLAHKIVCEEETDLPNWGTGGPNINSTTAADFVAASGGDCSFVSGWEFEWGIDGDAEKQTGGFVGKAGSGAGWDDFDTPTVGPTPAQVLINLDELGGTNKLWFREVLKDGYIPFTYPPFAARENNVSAEFYCHTDVINYDNFDWINNLVPNEVYYCVGFNVPEEPVEECGNGVLDPGEECDDGNTDNGDGCSAECTIEEPICGNGILEAGEQCDDGNVINGDGCNNLCQIEVPECGNGVLDPGEQCDDGNLVDGDGCSAECETEEDEPECGNGIVEVGEQCDDGNNNNNDTCSNQCDNQTPICHATSSETHPYNFLWVDDSAIDGVGANDHTSHEDDIIPITDLNGDGEIDIDDCNANQPVTILGY